jgi:hypothetical protein
MHQHGYGGRLQPPHQHRQRVEMDRQGAYQGQGRPEVEGRDPPALLRAQPVASGRREHAGSRPMEVVTAPPPRDYNPAGAGASGSAAEGATYQYEEEERDWQADERRPAMAASVNRGYAQQQQQEPWQQRDAENRPDKSRRIAQGGADDRCCAETICCCLRSPENRMAREKFYKKLCCGTAAAIIFIGAIV